MVKEEMIRIIRDKTAARRFSLNDMNIKIPLPYSLWKGD
jgi:hypothetical protein